MNKDEFEDLINGINENYNFSYEDYSYYKQLIPEDCTHNEHSNYCKKIADKLNL